MAEAKPEKVKVIPWWAIGLAVIFLAGVQLLFLAVVFRHDPHAPPLAGQIFVGFLAGGVLACLVLLVGYVNRDAKRRGMNVTLWTLIVIFVPDGIGFVIYFLMRQPLRVTCPNCGTVVDSAFNFCPKCKFNLHPICPECHHAVRAGDLYCPFCGRALASMTSRPSPSS